MIFYRALARVAENANRVLCAVERACDAVLHLKALKHRHRNRRRRNRIKAVPEAVAYDAAFKAACLRASDRSAAAHLNLRGGEVFDRLLVAGDALVIYDLLTDRVDLIGKIKCALARKQALLHVFAQKALVDTALADIIADGIYLDYAHILRLFRRRITATLRCSQTAA